MNVLVLGGTGTLGTELTRRLLLGGHRVTVFSRDELKQKQLAARLGCPQLRFRLGDIRDRAALDRAMVDVDLVFHVAALKHVDTLEANPEESVATNILGTINVADSAEAAGVGRVIFSSTDKAVAPVNAYGMSKALSEKILFCRNKTQDSTLYSVYRWGNVIASRGSVIPTFAEHLRSGQPLPLTDSRMTRFWIRIEDAADYMLKTYTMASLTEPMIPPTMKAASVIQIGETVAHLLGQESPKWVDVPIRPGEKLHEAMTEKLNSEDGPKYLFDELLWLLRGSV